MSRFYSPGFPLSGFGHWTNSKTFVKMTYMYHMNPKIKIVVLCGPTAIGKTAAAIALAGSLKGEIVNADSMQIYRYMDIGTAKPTPEDRKLVPHHLVDIADPDQDFDAAKFSAKAHDVISHLNTRQITPIVAGGTGLYIKALVHGLFEMMPADPEIRDQLKEQVRQFGVGYLYEQLRKIDPETSQKLHSNDLQRIMRAIEVYFITGNTISSHQKRHGFGENPFKVLKIGLIVDREALYRRVEQRVDAMIRDGLLDEVIGLLAKGYSKDLKSMQSIGYRHMTDFIEGQTNWQETIRVLKRDTRRYAKRQLTWFNKDKDIKWKSPDEIDEIIKMVKTFLLRNESN